MFKAIVSLPQSIFNQQFITAAASEAAAAAAAAASESTFLAGSLEVSIRSR